MKPDLRMNAMKEKCLLRNESGSVMVLALIMLALLTLLGIAATTTSTIEIQVARNERLYKENFYRAEAAVMENAQRIKDGGPEMKNSSNFPAWLHIESNLPDPDDITGPSNWTDASSQVSIDPNTRLLTVFEGLIGSLDMDKPTKVYSYSIYGRCLRNNGLVMIRAGYRKRI